MRVRIPPNPPNMKKVRLTKRQKAIDSILGLIETEGLDYGLTNWSVADELKIIGDDELTKLVSVFRETSKDLSNKIALLEEEMSEIYEKMDE
jgi:hypothetical protein